MTKKIELKKELELKILSLMLSQPETIPAISQKVKAEDLSKQNRTLLDKVLELNIQDSSALIYELSKTTEWKLADLMNLQTNGLEFSYENFIYNKIFEQFYDINFSIKAEDYLKRKLKSIRNDFCGLDTLIDLQGEIDTLLKSTENFKEEKSFSDKLPEIYNELEDELTSKNIHSFTVSNIPSISSSAGGFRPSNLIGIGGAYKSGKTTLGLNITLDFVRQGIPCGFFSLELSEVEINRKLLGMLSGIEYEKLREPKKLNDNERKKLSKFYIEKKELPLYITDKPMNEIEIKNKMKFWRDRFGVKIVCVDYVGYIKSRKKFDTREREMSYYSEFLKSAAKELNLIVIVLAQLNRTGKLNPGTENLAESIALARDCDFLFIIYNPFELGIKSNGITYTESNFIVKLDTTRHTKHKKQFLLNLKDDGNFIEIATEYQNDYQLQNNNMSVITEPEEIF
jgi:replicative DNA helicase